MNSTINSLKIIIRLQKSFCILYSNNHNNGYFDFFFDNASKLTKMSLIASGVLLYEFNCNGSIDCEPYNLTLSPGSYRIEAWGAQGGNNTETTFIEGGKGGYAKGVLSITSVSTLYISPGEPGFQGQYSTRSTYGNVGLSITCNPDYLASSGGGMSYVSLNTKNYTNSIIIGGAGAGSGMDHTQTNPGGAAVASKTSTESTYWGDKAIGQEYFGGYASGFCINGGGGGLYGGNAGLSAYGGSSFVSSTLTNAEQLGGDSSMPSKYSLSGTMTGNQGLGAVRITFLSNTQSMTCSNDIDSNCVSCINNGRTCSKCKTGYSLYNNKCYKTCPSGTFQSGTNCLYCGASNCDACPSSSPICFSCKSQYYFSQSQCYGTAPIGAPKCSTLNCSSCSESGTICYYCSTGYYLYNNQCLKSCPAGTYQLGSNCQKCTISNCDECSSSSTCTKCSDGYLIYNNQCLNQCPSGTYQLNGTYKECSVSNCDSCTSSGKCNSCKAGYNLYENTCLAHCPEGTYGSNGLCKPCDKSCKSCNGPNENNCLQCNKSKILSDGKCLAITHEEEYFKFNKNVVGAVFIGEMFV